MAKTRKFSAYRSLDKPYTRTSKYRAKSYIRMTKNPRIVRWHMGSPQKKYAYVYKLISKEALQIRDLAIESCRTVVNRHLEKYIGKENYYLHLRLYPHHIIREHALASGAGADRMSSGMARPFGKPVHIAAQLKKPGQTLFEVFVNKSGLAEAKKAMNKGKTKLPGTYTIQFEKVEVKEVTVKAANKIKVQKAVEEKAQAVKAAKKTIAAE
ncbi:50S ribosomal protein L16 [Candidatus Woesearchaeota archaeon]|jgi:large subunit ribosomal protein L10e|nr:50S ribosomal protein L16 [Candidatus Woesearchaeota archaeon]MBT4368290.1 50S ribosomal protein L16 [Candidatus Woesearchaeota archaeon]MBT4712779.1 50S ribosomal protein L16 [Candidatus Woesearchaeota archaeon]MBT6639691.1 50S ribosomal protein L16 [Candidatus Woesearchaeota archaeon]MBT7133863.1 50S ribosomal protein L16 [Candidatus Woesearchaeota archaeon]